MWVFRERTLSRLKRRTLPNRLEFSLCGTLSHPCQGSVFEKTPLGTLKNFFRCVKAKPDGLWAFRAGTSSHLKRLGLFRSCRREASPKAQGFSEDASHHARKHKTPQRGRRTVSLDRFPKINGSGIPGSLPFHEKYVAHPQKKFSDRPLFQKGSPGAGGALRREPG